MLFLVVTSLGPCNFRTRDASWRSAEKGPLRHWVKVGCTNLIWMACMRRRSPWSEPWPTC